MDKEKSMTYEQALPRVAAMCSRSEQCVFDITDKLRKWGVTAEDIENVIEKLIKEKFLDDSRFCRSFINDKYKYNRWGRIKIIYALKLKKINSEIIYNTIDDVINEEIYFTNLNNLLREKRKSIKGKDKYEIKAKLFRFAAGRGFESDEISKVIDEFL